MKRPALLLLLLPLLLAQTQPTTTSRPITKSGYDEIGGLLIILHPSLDKESLYNCTYQLPLNKPAVDEESFVLTLRDRNNKVFARLSPKLQAIDNRFAKMRIVEFKLNKELIKNSTLSFTLNPNTDHVSFPKIPLGNASTSRKVDDKILFEPIE